MLELELDNNLKMIDDKCKNCQYKRAYIGEDNPEHFENWYCLKMPTSPIVYTPCVRILKCPLEKTTVCLD